MHKLNENTARSQLGAKKMKKRKIDWLIIAVKKEDEKKLIEHIKKLFPKWKDFSHGSKSLGDIILIRIFHREPEITELVLKLDFHNVSLPPFDRTKYILIDKEGFI